VPGTSGEQLIEWARRADGGSFSSLGTIDRVAYPNLEPLTALAAAAAVTERIRLATTILIAPLRSSATMLAKQAASVHKISGGRLVLGIAVGGREDDYAAAGADFGSRGDRFDRMLTEITGVWSGSARSSGSSEDEGVEPDVAGWPPQLIVGGAVDAPSGAPPSTATAGSWAAARPRCSARAARRCAPPGATPVVSASRG